MIEVFTTRQKCDGIESACDSDTWLNRLLRTDRRAALCVVMPYFIVLRLKGSPLWELHYSTPCSFWYTSPLNKDHVSTARDPPPLHPLLPADRVVKHKNAPWQDTDWDRELDGSPTSKCFLGRITSLDLNNRYFGQRLNACLASTERGNLLCAKTCFERLLYTFFSFCG